MWNSFTKLLGLNATDDEDDDEGITARIHQRATSSQVDSTDVDELEVREYDGTVTSLHSTYGLIDKEIFFTNDVVQGGVMPQVGERVRVKAQRPHGVGGWRAQYINKINIDISWDLPETLRSIQPNETEESLTDQAASQSAQYAAMEFAEEFAREHLALQKNQSRELQELLTNKSGISITDCLDFGQMELETSSSLLLEIK